MPRGVSGPVRIPCPGADYVAVICPGAVMPLLRAVPVMLSAGERTDLEETRPGGEDGATGTGCARRSCWLPPAAGTMPGSPRTCGISVDTVRKWRGRFAGRGLDGLADLPRSGRPRRISELDRAAVVALACQLPAATGVPLARWTGPELAGRAHRPARGWPARRHPRCCGSWPSTRSSPGSTSRGSTPATRTSRPGRRSSWTCTRGSTRASGCGPATGSCPSTPSRPIQARGRCHPTVPGRARQARARRARIRPRTAPSRCWPRWTCTPGRCSPPPRPPPGSPRSWT